jgi:hypothetical protein
MAKKKYTLVDIYKNYEKDHLSNDKYSISKELFKQIATLLFKEVSKEIIYEGAEIKLPYRMGRIFIKKFIPSNPKKNVNFHLTNLHYGEWNKLNPDNKKVIYHTNKHSSGYSGRWFWDKSECVVTNKSLYRFDATRANSRETSKAIKFHNTIHKYAS